MSILQQAIDALAEGYPEEHAWIFTKKQNFHHPDYSPIKVAQLAMGSHLLAGVIAMDHQCKINGLDLAWRNAAIRAQEFDWPIYHLSSAYMEAVHTTTPPDDMPLSDLKLPFKSTIFALHRPTARQIFGTDIPFVCISGVELNEQISVPRLFWPTTKCTHMIIKNHSMLFFGGISLSTKDGIPLNYGSNTNWNWKYGEVAGWNPTEEEYSNPLAGNPDFENTDIGDNDKNLPVKIAVFGTKLLAILNTGNIRDLADQSNYLSTFEKRAKGHDYHRPVWIGQHYKAKSEPGVSTGRHNKMHWRRGHIRRQHFGPGLTEVKLIWIEPVLVNKTKEVV